MSVVIEQLTKVYGTQHAVDAISFEVKKGEILGFLGPNGAGKTTTMKIVTCFIPKTSGRVEVCGFDTENNSIDIRKKIGYLPEHNPLYKDMYVKEYLLFVAGLHQLKQASKTVDAMIERTGLTREQHKQIGSLSKGYRQRVGLAQAMLHDPEVLILDEPISGLDPNQLVEIRQLIKDLGNEKTVIFSSHIMQEVQALCDRVVVIDKGKLVANDTIDGLRNSVAGSNSLIVEFEKAITIKDLQKLPQISNVEQLEGDGFRYQIQVNTFDNAAQKAIFNFAVTQNLPLLEMRKKTFSIEDAFQALTK